MGRDFTADGTIEAAEVREGDLAPDGSGPLHLERGIEVGHIFQLGRKYAKSLGLTVLDENGKSQVVTMGSYGIGVSRVLAALAETNSDERGLAWPANIAPFDVHVLATGKTDEIFDTAASISSALEASLAHYDAEHGDDVTGEAVDEDSPRSADTARSPQGKTTDGPDPSLVDTPDGAEDEEDTK